MHYSKRFIAFGGIVAIAFLIKYNIPGAEYEHQVYCFFDKI